LIQEDLNMRIFSATMVALLAMATFAGAAVIDFDVATDLDDFAEAGATGGDQFVHSTAAGADGATGRADTDMPGGGDNEVLFYTGESFDFTGQSTLSISTAFLFDGDSPTAATRFGVGFVDNTSGTGFYDLDTAVVHVRMQLEDDDTVFFRSQQFLGDGSSFENGPDGVSIDLTPGSWYELSVDFTPDASGVFSFDADFVDVASDTSLGTFSGSFSGANSALAGDSEVYGGIRVDSPAKIGAIDNVEVIPEPTTLAVIGLGGVLVARRRRR
jgi:hypothetical protein